MNTEMTTNTTKRVKPNPGSDEAIKAGCKCPVLDNSRGKGSGHGEGSFWINEHCSLHGKGKD